MKQTIEGPFFEAEPTVIDELKQCIPTADGSLRYLKSLFPCFGWLPRYNWRWLVGDSIAGLTVGLVVIPQAMAYALLATLPPDFGLYTSFAGAATYWLFGTSKDIVIGTTAIGSLLVGEIVTHVHEARPDTYTSVEIAKTLSFMTGIILFALGLLRLGWLVEVIPYIPVSAFITAASIIIMCTQLPVLLGIPGVNTRDDPYKVLISTMRKLPDAQLDAAIGITCLVLLELAKYVFTKLEARQPARKKLWSIMSSLRLTFAMLLYTLVSYLVNRNLHVDPPSHHFHHPLTKTGFIHAGPPALKTDLIGAILPQSPIILVILIVEHIAIAKSFGKKLGYDVVPSQEIMAQGTANVLGPFLGGYSCTGSFGASAVLSKAGVKTPLAGLFSAFMLLLALYALTGVFYFIPRAALAGLIIHAVFNLIASPSTVRKYWRLSPFECLIWVVGVVMAVFTGLEPAIYTTTGLSFLLLLVRIARTRGDFLGKVEVEQTIETPENTDDSKTSATRDVYLSLDRNDASNRDILVESPHGGVLIYHFPEGLNYLNQAQHLKNLTDYVYTHTRRPDEEQKEDKGEALWCDTSGLCKQDNDLPQNTTMTSLLTGAVFGSGLSLSGVANPQVIRDQFSLSDFHMVATFLTASATSAVVFAGYNNNKTDNKIPIKLPSNHGWLGSYDGNIIGGAILGLGISLTGACPGTVLVQATAGVGHSRLLACTSLLAGIAWVKIKPLVSQPQPPTSRAENNSVMLITGWSANKVLIGYEITLLGILAAILVTAPRSETLLHPVVGGLLIGVGQLSSVLFTKRPVGVSGAYGEFGSLFWDLVSGKTLRSIPESILFAGGVVAGSWLTITQVPAIREAMVTSQEQSLPSLIIGGILLTFGARIAGGCTSGHGISGMASMGVSSFITIVSMFGAGVLFRAFFP
ncbi:hypothetical protein HYE67_005188 [Fusarium culmorum]|uniref:Sulfate permease 2 n=1 Tax=Fusarium culmorum TaxID=5516 RepID=A0A2T4GY91_FUSCU|nr:Sulfate permease 2 [Fusarium culmorum]QPC62957.1 hypothetical protein HYE67_005188 [Fusarium culmorum]